MKISAIVKCQLLDEELFEMTKEAISTIKPYVDELILVDQGSVVGKEWMLETSDIYLRNPVSKGFPDTVKQGMEYATGDYVAMLNNDIKFSGNWVDPLIKLFTKDVAIVHPNCMNWGDKFYHGDRDLVNTTPLDGLFFSAFIMDPKIYKKVGGWDTDYDFWGYDDWDYYYRTRKAGYTTILTNRVGYWHKAGATINKIGRANYAEKNRELFKKKHKIDPHDVNWYRI